MKCGHRDFCLRQHEKPQLLNGVDRWGRSLPFASEDHADEPPTLWEKHQNKRRISRGAERPRAIG